MTMFYNRSYDESLRIRADASNIRPGTNPAYVVSDFLAIYPQFGEDDLGNPVIPTILIEMYIDMAQECIMEVRWHKQWKYAISLYIAHFCTLYLQTMADPNDGAAAVFESGAFRGVVASESSSDVSISYDRGMLSSLDSWAAWGMTMYGVQLATLGRMVGLGGMMV